MKTIEINGYNGPRSLTAAAVEFAVDDIKAARRVIAMRGSRESGNVTRIRCKVAVRRLQSARQQLKAAIALLECEL
jgi:hypothetical protein